MGKQNLKILLAAPRGFCAGVYRAIQIVERALEKYGAPVYVRHEIVHNKFVVDRLRDKGAVFVEKLSEIPDDGQPVIFSAHGVARSMPQEAARREMFYIDATCPLVSKVHREAERHYNNGDQVILIGHGGHPEVVGTMGQLVEGAALLVESTKDVERLSMSLRGEPLGSTRQSTSKHTPSLGLLRCARNDDIIIDPERLAYCTQTTLSVDDTADIIEALKNAFPAIKCPKKEDICYATTNRQGAMKSIAPLSDMIMVLGAPNSSNSNRLVEVAASNGCKRAMLVQRVGDIDWAEFDGVSVLGLSAGASAPEILIEEVIEKARNYYNVELEEVAITREDVTFKLPKILT